MAARSFCTMVTSAEALARSLAGARAEVSGATGGLVFVAGALTHDLPGVAGLVRSAWRGVPTCIVPAAGVITERGEVEGAPAAAGLLWSGGKVVPFALPEASPPGALRDTLGNIVGQRAATVLLFARSDFSAADLEGISSAAPQACVLGAGAVGGAPLLLDASGEALRGRNAGLALLGSAPPLVESSPACRLLTPLGRIAETSGSVVLTLGDTPALDVLSSCVPELRGAGAGAGAPQPVVFAALAPTEGDDRFLIRPVRGIDPTRKGVLIGPEARVGMRMAFAVRDAASARSSLEAATRHLAQQALGAAPRFALYLSCAGRGQSLHGSPDVEARILRQRFGDLPIAGMHSAFEIAPWAPGEAKIALYTGVLALFRSPS
ncbi:MAG: FIST C-terminal domain-containing protein [Byssovorax sp.]